MIGCVNGLYGTMFIVYEFGINCQLHILILFAFWNKV